MRAGLPRMWSIGIDIGGTFTDVVVRGPERTLARKVLTHPRRPGPGGGSRHRGTSRGGAARSPARSTASCMRPPSSPTPSSSARARAPVSSPPGGFETPWRSDASASTSSTTSPSPSRRRSCRATGGSRRPNGWGRTGRWWRRSTSARSTRRCPGSRGAGSRRSRSRFLHAYANPEHECRARARLAERFPGVVFAIFVGGRAGDPRVRKALDHRRQRLPDAARRPLRRAARGTDRRARDRVPAPPHALERGAHGRRRGAAVPRCGCSSPVRRRGPSPPPGSGSGPGTRTCSHSTWGARRPSSASSMPANRSSPTCSRPAGTPLHPGERTPAQDLGPRSHRDWRRRGKHRLRRRPRAAQGRARERGIRARTRVLRARRPAPDGHRRRPHARLPRSRVLCRGGDAASHGRRVHCPRLARGSKRALRGGDRVGDLRGGHREHGERGAGSRSRGAAATLGATRSSRPAGRGPSTPGRSPRGSVSNGSCARRPRGSPRRSGFSSRPPGPTGRRPWPSPLPPSTGPGSKRRSDGSRRSAGRCWRTPDARPDSARIVRSADLRFRGQDFELVVELPEGPYAPASEAGIAEAFRAAYERTFSRVPPGIEIEVVNVRVAARAGGAGGGSGGRRGRRRRPGGSVERARFARGPVPRTSRSTDARRGPRSSTVTPFAPATVSRVRRSSRSASRRWWSAPAGTSRSTTWGNLVMTRSTAPAPGVPPPPAAERPEP